jgi:hypothetical protein
MPIDVHAQDVPRQLPARIEAEGADIGVKLRGIFNRTDRTGGRCKPKAAISSADEVKRRVRIIEDL